MKGGADLDQLPVRKRTVTGSGERDFMDPGGAGEKQGELLALGAVLAVLAEDTARRFRYAGSFPQQALRSRLEDHHQNMREGVRPSEQRPVRAADCPKLPHVDPHHLKTKMEPEVGP